MALFIILGLFSLLFLNTESLKCPPLTFPHSEVQHLKFLCKQNQTTIQFPSYGELIVKSISYNPKKLDLVDPNNCVHRVFFKLNLTLTPFHYYYAVKDFTYLNCSSSALISPSYEPVPCLSGPGFSVYVVDPGLEVPVFCKALKTVGIPFGYSDYLDDDSFGLGLTWDLDCGHGCFSKLGDPRCFNGAHNKTVLWISILIFMVAMVMISAKTYCSKKMDMMNETKKNQIEVDKLLGDFEAL